MTIFLSRCIIFHYNIFSLTTHARLAARDSMLFMWPLFQIFRRVFRMKKKKRYDSFYFVLLNDDIRQIPANTGLAGTTISIRVTKTVEVGPRNPYQTGCVFVCSCTYQQAHIYGAHHQELVHGVGSDSDAAQRTIRSTCFQLSRITRTRRAACTHICPVQASVVWGAHRQPMIDWSDVNAEADSDAQHRVQQLHSLGTCTVARQMSGVRAHVAVDALFTNYTSHARSLALADLLQTCGVLVLRVSSASQPSTVSDLSRTREDVWHACASQQTRFRTG